MGSIVGVIGGVASALAISDKVEQWFNSDESPKDAHIPEPPKIPKQDQKLEPADGKMLLVLQENGEFQVFNGKGVAVKGVVKGESVFATLGLE